MHRKIRTFSTDLDLVGTRRMQIVKYATKVFIRQGFQKTNMRQLARACNMSAGTLYHYFGSKEDILFLIIDQATSQQAEHFEKFVKTLDTTNVTEAIRKFVTEFYQWHDQNQDITLFCYQETKNLPPSSRESIFDSENRIVATFESLIMMGIQCGEFNVRYPKLLAHNIVALAHMWALRRWFLRKQVIFDEYLREQIEYIFRIITEGTRVAIGARNARE